MIVKMLKTTLICRGEDRDATLDALRGLGMLHVEQVVKPESADQAALQQHHDKLKMFINVLAERKVKDVDTSVSPKEADDHAEVAIAKSAELKKRLESLERDQDRLEPWGDFSFDTIDKLAAKGLYVYLCVCHSDEELDAVKQK